MMILILVFIVRIIYPFIMSGTFGFLGITYCPSLRNFLSDISFFHNFVSAGFTISFTFIGLMIQFVAPTSEMVCGSSRCVFIECSITNFVENYTSFRIYYLLRII